MDELQWKKFPVLDDGFVCLVDMMGDDSSVVQAARVSYGRDERAIKEGESYERIRARDRDLIRYLMRHRHTTPFEMVELKFLVRVPMDCWRQWIRHRTASVNEYSTRYTEAIASQQTTKPDEWRLQSGSNKQGSGEFVDEWPEGYTPLMNGVDCGGDESVGVLPEFYPVSRGLDESRVCTPGEYLTDRELDVRALAIDVYKERLKFGVAREQARKDLPLSTYTEAYWKIDLHNLFHFLALRMDSHAQLEIRQYATTIGEQIVAKLLPICWEAFVDYRLQGMFLSRLDAHMIRRYIQVKYSPHDEHTEKMIPNKRERDECLEKLKRLGLL